MVVATGQSFGNFQVVRLIGEGGFGEVYEAENPFLQRRAAVKVLHTEMVQDSELVRRFLNEARAASAIRHPNIIEVFDAGVTPEGAPYILMEFLEGDSLQKALLQQGRMSLRLAQEIAHQAGAALSAAHAAGIVHRDLKPENIFLVEDAERPLGLQVKVLDFGIAKIKRQDDTQASTLRTQAGLLLGSPAYMSPEQCRDSSEVDLRTDIYSLAIITYEMLAGVPPFAAKSPTEMLVMQMTAEPPPLRPQVPDLPDYVEQTLARALAKDRELRFGSVDAFVGALLGTSPVLTTETRATSTGGSSSSTPVPVVVGNRVGLTPAPVARTTITTFSHATGEASSLPAPSESDRDFNSIKPRRWPIVVALGTVATTLALVFIFRTGTPSAPAQVVEAAPPPSSAPFAPTVMVHMLVQSTPAGANVLDGKDGTLLGITPLEKSYAQAQGTRGMVLRLAGYKDKSIRVALDANSSTSVDLERAHAAPGRVTATPTGPRAPSRKPSAVRQPPRPTHDEEDEWRVH